MKKYKLQLLLNEFRLAEGLKQEAIGNDELKQAVGHQRYSEGLATAAILLLKDEDRDWVLKKFDEITDESERRKAVDSYKSLGVVTETADRPAIPMLSIFKQFEAETKKPENDEKVPGSETNSRKAETETPEAETEEITLKAPEASEEITLKAPEAPEEITLKAPEAPEAESPKVETKRKSDTHKPRVRIDKGKVVALHKANWSAGKIADEMRCEVSTVYKILKSYNKGELKLDNEVWNEEA